LYGTKPTNIFNTTGSYSVFLTAINGTCAITLKQAGYVTVTAVQVPTSSTISPTIPDRSCTLYRFRQRKRQ
ncbi:MAG: hypothetical protein WCF90_06040, partial [Methanomicrobiales archaeon]